jgi:hypothetical protein
MSESTLLPYRVIIDFIKGIKTTIPGVLEHSLFKVSKEGKLLSLFCDYRDIFTGRSREYLEKRCLLTKLYTEHLAVIGEELNTNGVVYYVFKTLKPFPYDMTDLDLLFIDKRDMLLASKALIEKYGFKPIARGTYSISLRKTIRGLDIDLDLQTKIAAGTFEYIEISNIRKIVDETGYTSGKLSLLRPELELIVVMGHAFYKDFSISLANILYFDYLRRTISGSILNAILEHYPYLLKSFKLLNYFVNSLLDIIHTGKCYTISDPNSSLEYLLMRKSICEAFRKKQGFFPLPLLIVATNYVKTTTILIKNHKNHQLYELLNLPRSRGVGLLFRRIGALPPEETIRH